MASVEVKLPGGMPVGDQWCRSLWLRPVTGREEEFLLSEARHLPPALRVTQLIARCIERLGSVQPVSVEMVRQLSVGDREALLLHLRRLTLGERISCLLLCPQCQQKMDLDLTIGELLLPAYPYDRRTHAAELSDEANSYRVVFRVPNGADQEAVAEEARQSVDDAEESVLRRCVEEVNGEKVTELPEAVRRGLPAKMAALDPQAEILLDLTCPECGAGFSTAFDSADYICRELAMEEREFYREVYTLSWHYHWTEEAVLGLSRRKRRIYLDFLADEVGRGGYRA
jgi:phage FluMu protein gp41